MKSTFLCSRNDLIANSSVIVAAVLVGFTGTLWPDVIVGLAIAALFLHSARQVLAEAWAEWRHASTAPGAEVAPASISSCCAPQTNVNARSSCCEPQPSTGAKHS